MTHYQQGVFFTGPPLKVSDYIVNPIKKVLSVRIYMGLALLFSGRAGLKTTLYVHDILYKTTKGFDYLLLGLL